MSAGDGKRIENHRDRLRGQSASTVIVPLPRPLLVEYIGTAIVRVTGDVVIVKFAERTGAR